MALRNTVLELSRGTVSALVLRGAGVGFSFLLTLILAQRMGPQAYGNYTYLVSAAMIGASIAQLGLSTGTVRFVAEYEASGSGNLLRGLVQRTHQIVGGLGLLIAFVIFLFPEMLAPNDSESVASVRLVALLVPIMSLATLRQEFLRGLKRIIPALLPEMLVLPILFVSLLVAFRFFLNGRLDATQVLAMHVAALIVAFAVGSIFFNQSIKHKVSNLLPAYRTEEWIRISLPLFGSLLMVSISSQANILLIGKLLGAADTGVYALAVKIATLSSLVLWATSQIMSPMIASARNRDVKELQDILMVGAWIIVAVSLPVAVVLLSYGKDILSLVGSEYSTITGLGLLRILTVGQFLNAVSGPSGMLLFMTGHERAHVTILTVTTIAKIAIDFVVIPHYGVTGVAIVEVFSIVAWNLAMIVYIKTRLHLTTYPTYAGLICGIRALRGEVVL